MKLKNKESLINPEFADLFSQSSEENLNSEARMISYRFLSEIERINGNERGINKNLATSVDVSTSFISQLFNGDKLLNFQLLAKFQRALKIKFKVTAVAEESTSVYIDAPIM